VRSLLLVAFGIAIGVLIGAPRAQLAVSVFGLSKHSESGYCEVNPGLGATYSPYTDLRIGGGRYLNSKCRWTNAFGAFYTPLHVGDFSFGLAVLRLTGYRNTPVIAPLPVGAYRFSEHSYVDFFVVRNADLTVGGMAYRFQW